MSYSLEGEDRIIDSLLRKANIGTYFDIGCSDPIEISNTYWFYQRGWTGLCVDGRVDLSQRWRDTRPRDDFRAVLLGEVSGTTNYFNFPDPTLNTCDVIAATRYRERFSGVELLTEQRTVLSGKALWIDWFTQRVSVGGVDEHLTRTVERVTPPTFVSVDVEGSELSILRGLLSPEFRPPLLVVETKLFNFLRPLEHPVVEYLVGTHKYCLISKTPLDAFFIDPWSELFDWIPIEMRNTYETISR